MVSKTDNYGFPPEGMEAFHLEKENFQKDLALELEKISEDFKHYEAGRKGLSLLVLCEGSVVQSLPGVLCWKIINC